MKYDLICIDMFQTLVDINTRTESVWMRILGEDYTPDKGAFYKNQLITRAVNGFFTVDSYSSQFVTLRTVFLKYFTEIMTEFELKMDPEAAVDIFLEEHNYCESYDDVHAFFSRLKDRVRICLVSDADHSMVHGLLDRFEFDHVFISEAVGAYKNDPECRMFNSVLAYYQIDPKKVLHIGDSSADISGASRAGIASCWINRTAETWKHPIKPTFTVNSLLEVIDLID